MNLDTVFMAHNSNARLMKALTVFQYSSGSTTDASIWRASGTMSFSRSMLEHAS